MSWKKSRRQLKVGVACKKLKSSYKKYKPKLKKIRNKGITIRENINDYWDINIKEMQKISRRRGNGI